MKEIKLTQGYVALVDDVDYEYLNQWKWFVRKRNHTCYAERCAYLGGGRKNPIRKTIIMHRLIMNTPDNVLCDHIDHNGLNCQRHNLRNATDAQNRMNVKSSGSSKYLGVSIRQKGKAKGQIVAQIRHEGKKMHLGCFDSELEAAKRYDVAARYFFGEFANLNFK